MEIKAKKSLGQNFLINSVILDKIVAAAEINSNETILEIGPGTGNLTEKLKEDAGKIIAIEKDRRLIEELSKKFPSIELIEGDILKIDITKLVPTNYKVVGNIPYYITSRLIRTIF